MDGFVRITTPIGPNAIPTGLWWEGDGACWKAVLQSRTARGRDWRWQPMNERALGKDRPEGEMQGVPPNA